MPASARICIGALAALTLLVFADALFSAAGKVPVGGDVHVHGHLFEFAARSIRRGHVPLWNPHIFSGLPALGDPNAMTLYPVNLLNIVLPLSTAITVGTVIHVLLTGIFTYLWTSRRGLHPLGCLMAAGMVSFGAPFFTHLYAGHLSAMAAMTWVPLLFLAIDHVLERPSVGWVAIGAVSGAMQVLGGHPQYLFYSAVAALGYVLLRVRTVGARGRVVIALATMGIAGTALAAVQLTAVLDAAAEGARAGKLTYAFAGQFSMPWTGFLTLVVPGFFGHLLGTRYWGDWLYWEVTPFIGIIGLALAVYGAARGDRARTQGALALCVLFLVLALGANTPLLKVLHAWVPPFDRIRASGRALFHFSLFASMLAAAGFDRLLHDRRPGVAMPAALLGVAAILLGFGAWIRSVSSTVDVRDFRQKVEHLLRVAPSSRPDEIRRLAGTNQTESERLQRLVAAYDEAVRLQRSHADGAVAATRDYGAALVEAMNISTWQAVRSWLVSTKGYSYPLEDWADPAAGKQEAHFAVLGLVLASGICAAASGLLWWARTSPHAIRALAILGIVELACFARASRGTFDLQLMPVAPLQEFLRGHPGDYRVYTASLGNSAMSLGYQDIWGYDPSVPARYADYVAFTQRASREEVANGFFSLARLHPSYRMLRLRYVLEQHGDGLRVATLPDPLPHLLLVRDYEVIQARDGVLARIDSPSWDPTRTVLLESRPAAPPGLPADGDEVRLLDASSDHLTIEADVATPAILLVTDSWSAYWRARPLAGSSQTSYDVVPADFVLRGVPLAAGHHLLRMEYLPPHHRLGVAVSLTALTSLAVVGSWQLWRRVRRPAETHGAHA